MGIKSFSKVFEHHGEIKYKDLKGKTMAIDAMYQLHRMAHPFKTTKKAALLGPDGTSTNHINGLLALILNLKRYGVNQVWVFDNPNENHNNIKEAENKRRHSRNAALKLKYNNLLQTAQDKTFSDSDDNANKIALNKYNRAAFTLEPYMIDDLKYILNCFDIPWIEAPVGFEAEQIAAYMTNHPIDGITADGVISNDPDCLLFGARLMVKNDKGKLYRYNLQMLLNDAKIEQNDLIKAGVMLGSDFAHKTIGIGPKSVLPKLPTIKLTSEQQQAYNYFAKPICPEILTALKWNGSIAKSFANKEKITDLYKWTTVTKGFNEDRTKNRFNAAKLKM